MIEDITGNLGIVITGVVGTITTIVSSWATWFFSKKKYSAEVDSYTIANMQKSLDFYEKLSDDNRERLTETLQRNDKLDNEVRELREQVFDLMKYMCCDMSCKLRQPKLNKTK
jgi:hypothetical protein